jgi:hypothetical protein
MAEQRLVTPIASRAMLALVATGLGVAVFTSRTSMLPQASTPAQPKPSATTPSAPPPAAIDRALGAYSAGKYREAETAAAHVIRSASSSQDPALKQQAARARWVHAFAAARRKDLPVARERFALLRAEAARLPDKGKPEAKLGENPPTLEEEGAYQHAVLTAALGEESAAEREFIAFMREYPESPLVHAAVKRIARMHGGNIPPEADAAWKAAMATVQARERKRQREASMCGPEVLAELLDRLRRPEGEKERLREGARGGEGERGESREIGRLAKELGTDEHGTSLKALQEALKRRGIVSKGLKLTWAGLRKQRLPMVALVKPGHYVIVEAAPADFVRVWDPEAGGRGKPGVLRFSPEQWRARWDGVALVVE